jgi:hypothetical protein
MSGPSEHEDDFIGEEHPVTLEPTRETRGERIAALFVTCFITAGAALMVTMLLS